jgi:hypothetical protein
MGNNVTRIKDHNQISLILDVIHDCWFDVGDINYSPEESLLIIKFERELICEGLLEGGGILFKRVRIPTIECLLRFYHVRNFVITDTEKVGRYDLTGIEYQADLKRLFINTGIPLDIMLEVEQFEVVVEETDRVIRTRTRSSLLGW